MKIIGMDSKDPCRLGVVSMSLLEGFDDELLLRFFYDLMIFRDLHAWHRLLFQQGLGEVFGLNQFRGSEHDGPLHRVFEFANIAWPIVLDETLTGFGGNALNGTACILTEPQREIAGEERNIV